MSIFRGVPGDYYSTACRAAMSDRERGTHVRNTVRAIVCLAEKDELQEKSSEYAQALEAGTVPCLVLPFEIPDRGAPEDRDAFWTLAGDVAKRLQSGEAVLIHCAGGIGRTATLAICVLLALGEPVSNARSVVSRAGSTVETASQSKIISWCASQVSIIASPL